MTHYIATSGLSGYLPNYCEVFHTRAAAIESLVSIWEEDEAVNVDEFSAELKAFGLAFASEYEVCEVIACDCNHPQIHSENDFD